MLHGPEEILAFSVQILQSLVPREYSGVARKLSAQLNA
jgi:hypothetical protein